MRDRSLYWGFYITMPIELRIQETQGKNTRKARIMYMIVYYEFLGIPTTNF